MRIKFTYDCYRAQLARLSAGAFSIYALGTALGMKSLHAALSETAQRLDGN